MTDNAFSLLDRLEQRGNELDEMAAHRFAEVSRAVDNLLLHEVEIEVSAPGNQAANQYHIAQEVSEIDDSIIHIDEARRQLDRVYGGETADYSEYTEAA